jgi:hypothetical protein
MIDRSDLVARNSMGTGLARGHSAEAERIRYMERIISHFVPNIAFDLSSLRRMAEDLQRNRRDSDTDGPPTQVEIDDLEGLAIDDEDFTIEALPDSTTRRPPLSRGSLDLCTLSWPLCSLLS